MAEATLAGFREEFEEFSTDSQATDAQINRALAKGKRVHTVDPLATLYASAHYLRLALDRAEGVEQSGEIISEQIGPLRTTYQVQAVSTPGSTGSPQAFFTATSYGREYLSLQRARPRSNIGARVVG